jgi:predicted acylesterase/phospholipase RssA
MVGQSGTELPSGEQPPEDNKTNNPGTSGGRGAPMALIMKGGGIKGLAYVGALEVLSKHYVFNWYVGTSAGAITAILLAAGFTTDDMRTILKNKKFSDFFDAKRWWQKLFNLLAYGGFNKATAFTDWIDVLLSEKIDSADRVTLKQIAGKTQNRITVYACRRGRGTLPFDSATSDADAAYAARCSMSIPFVFVPQQDQGIWTYDGGIVLNYPIEQVLHENPAPPFIALYLGPEHYEPPTQRRSIMRVICDIASIVQESNEGQLIEKYKDHTVVIDPRPIDTLDFDLTDDEKEFLLACGRAAAYKHLDRNSAEFKTALAERDQLKKTVEDARKSKANDKAEKRRRRLRGFFYCMGAVVILISGSLLTFALIRWWNTKEYTPQELVESLDIARNNNSLDKWTTVRLKVVPGKLRESKDPSPHVTASIPANQPEKCKGHAKWTHELNCEWRPGYTLPMGVKSNDTVKIEGQIEMPMRIKRYCPDSETPPDPNNPDGYTWIINVKDCIPVSW